MNKRILRELFLSGVLAALLTSCGGGGGDSTASSGGTGGTGVSSGVVRGFGSVIVNDIHFDFANATVNVNDAIGAGTNKGLKVGMTVKVKGSFNADGATGTATDIEAEHEVEGLVEPGSIVPNTSFRVLGQTVYVDQLLDPNFDFAATIVENALVEVYGLRDSNGAIHATLIEVEDPADFVEELRGAVADLDTNAMTFRIGGYAIRYDATPGSPTPTLFEDGTAADLQNGVTVEVHLSNTSAPTPFATVIEIEDNEDSEFEAGDGEETEVEGYVSNYDGAAGTFRIGNVLVQRTPDTRLDPANGVLANNVKVEVEGTVSNGVLIASEIEFE